MLLDDELYNITVVALNQGKRGGATVYHRAYIPAKSTHGNFVTIKQIKVGGIGVPKVTLIPVTRIAEIIMEPL